MTTDPHIIMEKLPAKTWQEMDPLVRARFHEFGNHISRLEGILSGLNMRVPSDPALVPVMQEKVKRLEEGQSGILAKMDNLDEKLNKKIERLDHNMTSKVDGIQLKLDGLTLRVVGGTTLLTVIGSVLVQVFIR